MSRRSYISAFVVEFISLIASVFVSVSLVTSVAILSVWRVCCPFSISVWLWYKRRSILAVSFILFAGSIAGIKYFSQNLSLTSKNILLDAQLAETMTVLDEIQANRTNLIAEYEGNIAKLEEDREQLLEGSISRLDEKNKVIE